MSDASDRVLMSVDARGVAAITLNRPEVGNAYDGALIDAGLRAIDQLERHKGLRAIVIRGNGRHFQAGADLGWLDEVRSQSHADNVRASKSVAELMRRLNLSPVPTVALVQGACFGGGTGLVASCDVVIGAEDARFSIAETRWGMIAGIIIPQLNDAISVRQVRRYALTGERFDAAEALRIGLLHQVVPLAELESAGERVIDALLQNAPEANAQTKLTALQYAWSDLSELQFNQLVEQHAAKRQSSEAAEGLASFHDKRQASWYPDHSA